MMEVESSRVCRAKPGILNPMLASDLGLKIQCATMLPNHWRMLFCRRLTTRVLRTLPEFSLVVKTNAKPYKAQKLFYKNTNLLMKSAKFSPFALILAPKNILLLQTRTRPDQKYPSTHFHLCDVF